MKKRKQGRQVLIRILRSNAKHKKRKTKRQTIRGRGAFSNGFSFLGDLGKQEKESILRKDLPLKKE